jgi:hypothetical protein
MTRATLTLEPDTFDVPLGDVTYTSRPFTNALRAKLGEQLDERRRLGNVADRLQLRAAHLDESSTVQELEKIQDETDEHNKAWRELNVKLLALLLVDPEGKAPTPKALNDHASSRAIGNVVATILGDREPDPTTASTDAR